MRTCMRADVRTLAGVGPICVRSSAYICMYDYYIILLYMRVQCVGTCVRTCICMCMRTYMRTCLQAHVRTRVRT